MATQYTSEDDSRTIELIKIGLENCLFQTPQMILNAISKYFGDANISMYENTPKEGMITFHCRSSKWSSSNYYRIFVIIYEKYNEKEFKIIEVQEIEIK